MNSKFDKLKPKPFKSLLTSQEGKKDEQTKNTTLHNEYGYRAVISINNTMIPIHTYNYHEYFDTENSQLIGNDFNRNYPGHEYDGKVRLFTPKRDKIYWIKPKMILKLEHGWVGTKEIPCYCAPLGPCIAIYQNLSLLRYIITPVSSIISKTKYNENSMYSVHHDFIEPRKYVLERIDIKEDQPMRAYLISDNSRRISMMFTNFVLSKNLDIVQAKIDYEHANPTSRLTKVINPDTLINHGDFNPKREHVIHALENKDNKNDILEPPVDHLRTPIGRSGKHKRYKRGHKKRHKGKKGRGKGKIRMGNSVTDKRHMLAFNAITRLKQNYFN